MPVSCAAECWLTPTATAPPPPDGRSLHTAGRRPPPQHGHKWLSVPEAARLLDLPYGTLRGRLRSNLVPHLRRNGYFWLREDIAVAEAARPHKQRDATRIWVSYRDVLEQTDLTIHSLKRAIREGYIQQRELHRSAPSLTWVSVQAYLGVPAAEIARGSIKPRKRPRSSNVRRPRPPAPRPHPVDGHDWLNPHEAAAILGLTRCAVLARCGRDQLPSVMVDGRRWLRSDQVAAAKEQKARGAHGQGDGPSS